MHKYEIKMADVSGHIRKIVMGIETGIDDAELNELGLFKQVTSHDWIGGTVSGTAINMNNIVEVLSITEVHDD